MSAGEFVASYNTPEAYESFDCVATCFFIDTARNLLDYMGTIRNILREGGAWINHGPLLWHFEGSDATEPRNSGDNKHKYGDLRGFDQVQADVEDAEGKYNLLFAMFDNGEKLIFECRSTAPRLLRWNFSTAIPRKQPQFANQGRPWRIS